MRCLSVLSAAGLLLAAAVCGCSHRDERGVFAPADLKGCRVAHLSSDFHKRELQALQPDLDFKPYSEYAFAVESLRQRKIDAISLGRSYADIWTAKFPGEFRIAFDYASDTCSFLLPKGSELKPALDGEIRKLRESGGLAAIVRKWCAAACTDETLKVPAFPDPPAGAREVSVAAAAQAEPWCFVSQDGLAGIDIEVLATVAARLGWRLKLKTYNWDGMVDAVNAGNCDIANGGIYTGGHEFPTVDASEKYADEPMCILVRDERPVAAAKSAARSAAASLRRSFVRTFVTEERWRMVGAGLGVTLLITFLSAAFGTLLAFPVWWARTSRVGALARCAKGYVAVLQGTPLLVLLLVLFYIVFGRSDVNGVWIAVFGFSLNASAYIGEMLRSGIESVPRGQTEAALALGYRPRRAFFRFVLPQAVRAILPVYRGQLIGMLKNTSIVGYIAINDLTKASDLIRSRTYESFFPILTTAFVYVVLSWLLALALDRLGRRLDPAFRRSEKAKGRN